MDGIRTKRNLPDISSFGLHLLAMALMFCDHAWATLPNTTLWLTALGRIAFPIFAFLLAEGHARTRDVKRYRKRLLLLAVLTEIPFNLMCSGSVFYPFHQNVIWTFLIASPVIGLIDRAREKRTASTYLSAGAAAFLGFCAGYLCFVDYYGPGVLTVLVFYVFRGSRLWQRAGQAACLYWIHAEMLRGQTVLIPLSGQTVEIPLQSLALLALIPIWLYRGRQGPHGKAVKAFTYAFYPVHMLLLYCIAAAM